MKAIGKWRFRVDHRWNGLPWEMGSSLSLEVYNQKLLGHSVCGRDSDNRWPFN